MGLSVGETLLWEDGAGASGKAWTVRNEYPDSDPEHPLRCQETFVIHQSSENDPLQTFTH
ncbi:hypothetical protein U0070_024607 [Myodes glareolus]|uniref:Uncharacterized protein n=1 Tax=Myodes glareolus TaxID=447135 RepID=A0AAW0JWD3_MYOGA